VRNLSLLLTYGGGGVARPRPTPRPSPAKPSINSSLFVGVTNGDGSICGKVAEEIKDC
jgi:hypothetical protein